MVSYGGACRFGMSQGIFAVLKGFVHAKSRNDVRELVVVACVYSVEDVFLT